MYHACFRKSTIKKKLLAEQMIELVYRSECLHLDMKERLYVFEGESRSL